MHLIRKDLLGRVECLLNHKIRHCRLLELGSPSNHRFLQWSHPQLNLCVS
jgi:hypothetical protein